MDPAVKEKEIRFVFVASLILKGLNALLEIALGLFFLATKSVAKIIIFFTEQEFIEDPTDFLATHVRAIASYLSFNLESFAAFYLLGHGVIKIFLVWGLLKNKMWAYPAVLVFLSLFIIYQAIRFTSTHSIFLLLLTIFDIFLLWLVSHEYNYLRRKPVEVIPSN